MFTKPTLIIYGATAFSAGPLLTHLDDHPQSDQFELILSGRNQQKLQEVEKKLKKQVKIIAVSLNDLDGVRALVEKGDVVLNLAGPFGLNGGEALVRACAETGTHYTDITGEGNWLSNKIVPNYDYLASTTGACIVPSCGFDSVPSDITVYSSLKALQISHPGLTITSTKSFFTVRGTVSGGSFATLLTELKTPREERRRDEWALVTSYPQKNTSSPKLLYDLTLPSGKTLLGSFWVMFAFNRMIVRRSWHLSRIGTSFHGLHGASTNGQDTGSQSLSQSGYNLRKRGKQSSSDAQNQPENVTQQPQIPEPRHGDNFSYEEAMTVPSAFTARLISIGLIGFFLLMVTSSVFRWIAKKFMPQQGDGSSLDKLKKGWSKIDSVSETTDPEIKVVTKVKMQGDPGYLWTCYSLAESALALVLPPPEGTSLPPMSQVGGVLTPATAMGGVLIKRLEQYGRTKVETEVVEVDSKGK